MWAPSLLPPWLHSAITKCRFLETKSQINSTIYKFSYLWCFMISIEKWWILRIKPKVASQTQRGRRRINDANMYRTTDKTSEKGQKEAKHMNINYNMTMNVSSCPKLRSMFKGIKPMSHYCIQFEITVVHSSRYTESKRVWILKYKSSLSWKS